MSPPDIDVKAPGQSFLQIVGTVDDGAIHEVCSSTTLKQPGQVVTHMLHTVTEQKQCS